MRDIQEVIAQKERLVAQLQKEIETLKTAATILEANVQDADKPRSRPEMVAAILEQVGQPMHVAQIADQLRKRFKVPVKKTNLGVLLFRYSQRESRFYKVLNKPNTYGLLKWRSDGEKGDVIRLQPEIEGHLQKAGT